MCGTPYGTLSGYALVASWTQGIPAGPGNPGLCYGTALRFLRGDTDNCLPSFNLKRACVK